MKSFIVAFKKEWLEQRRTKKLLIALIVIVLFGMLSPLMAKFMPQFLAMIPGAESFAGLIPAPTINDAVAQYIKNTSQFTILLALLFGMGAMAGEKEKGQLAMILAKPISRAAVLLAKFAAQALTFLLAIALAGIACYYYTYVLFGALNLLSWLELNGLLLLYTLVYSAITLFFSTLTRTQYVAIGGAFGALVVFGILASIPGLTGYLPDGLVANAAALMMGGSINSWACLWISLALVGAAIAAACLVFQHQEI